MANEPPYEGKIEGSPTQSDNIRIPVSESPRKMDVYGGASPLPNVNIELPGARDKVTFDSPILDTAGKRDGTLTVFTADGSIYNLHGIEDVQGPGRTPPAPKKPGGRVF